MADPFVFMTSVEAIQLTGMKASNLAELHEGLQRVDGASIYYHTHRFYRAHPLFRPPDKSDFSLWLSNNLREEAVAERMEALDFKDFHNLQDIGRALLALIEPLQEDKERWYRRVPPGLEFYFCRAVSLVMPIGYEAGDLEEFIHALEEVDVTSLYYHLIEAPLHLETGRRFNNDFSQWLFNVLKLEEKASVVASVDPYRADLEGLRQDLLAILERNLDQSMTQQMIHRVSHNAA